MFVGAQIYTSSIALLQGSYSGFVDSKRIPKNLFDWSRNIDEK